MDCARNIITANFSGGGTSATTAPLWQWDYGQVLCITGIEDLPAAFEVHFSTNRTGGVSTVAVGADGQVTIPNGMLTIGKNLNAWIYLSDAQGEGETEYSILIPVKARPMPETYDAEVSGEFDDVVRQVSEYAETAQTAADNAGASASAAATSASEAAASASAAETAKNAAETAQGNAEGAQAAAETAAQTATEKAQQTAQDAAHAALDAGRAESAAGRAEAAETGAESAKTDAETAAQDAADSASAASASAISAGQAATSAGQSATAAAGSATTAQGAAQTATAKAGEASASASAAAASETAAQTAQTAAEAAKDTAVANATTATTKAAEAAQSASNAAQSKTDAEAAATRAETAAATLTVDDALSDTSTNPVENRVITGAIRALQIEDTASGAIASFPDGAAMPMESLTVGIEPIQDLHGQDAPYPAGGGKNKLPITLTSGTYYGLTVAVDDKDGIKLTGTTDSTGLLTLYSGDLPSGITPGESYIFSWESAVSTMRLFAYNASNVRTVLANSGSATSVNVTIPSDAVRLSADINVSVSGTTYNVTVKPMIRLASVSDATYAPYSNICPITGRTEVTVTRTGINIWGGDRWYDSGASADRENRTVSGTNATSLPLIALKAFKPNTAYTFIVTMTSTASNGYTGYRFTYTDGTSTVLTNSNIGSTKATFVFVSNANKTLSSIQRVSYSGTKTYWVDESGIFEGNLTAADFIPYQGQQVTIQLGQTVYGGNAEIISGQGENTMGMVDLGTLNWTYQASSGTNLQRFVSSGIADSVSRKVTQDGCMLNMACSIYTPSSQPVYTRSQDNTICVLAQTGVLYICDSRFTDAASFKAAMSGVQLCYELAQPTALTLTPASLSTLKGQNNVWSDGDTVNVDYVADPKLYIARLTEPDADMVADANITSGSYFMVGNTLYLATANIASGAAITLGVNCTRTNLADALNAINA